MFSTLAPESSDHKASGVFKPAGSTGSTSSSQGEWKYVLFKNLSTNVTIFSSSSVKFNYFGIHYKHFFE